MNHFIPLDQAKKMTALYRKEKENILSADYKGKDILSNSETFDAEAFRTLLNKEGCKSLRIYFGMDDGLKVHLITVAVNEKGEEMLEGSDAAVEDGVLCPPICPTSPPYNLNYD